MVKEYIATLLGFSWERYELVGSLWDILPFLIPPSIGDNKLSTKMPASLQFPTFT